ncbi:MAG: hypothetical protein JW867_03865 [Candidatus Omnitrophica bacterium]|nr:hypothetical protein [Candidatus Omnitrophota bacterium]
MSGNAFKAYFIESLDKIINFEFNFDNVVMWTIFILVFFILLRFWDVKKSLSYCLVNALVLLASTKIENIFETKLAVPGEAFDPIAVRIVTVVALMLVGLYYGFIKTDSAY